MKKISIEVRTTYTIELSGDELWAMYCRYEGDKERRQLFYPKAFDTMRGLNMPSEFYGKLRNWLLNAPHGDTYAYIAKELGFDGWSFAGSWNAEKQVYRMTVYNTGADI